MANTSAGTFQFKNVDAREANALLSAPSDFIVLDITSPKEIKGGYIKGAVFADFFAKNFEEELF